MDWRRGLGGVLDLIFPRNCLLCGRGLVFGEGLYICPDCMGGIRLTFGERCPRCAAFLGPYTYAARDCPICRGKRLAFGRAVAIGPYSGPLREMILRFKYQRLEYLVEPLASMLSGVARKEGLAQGQGLLMSVPLHWTRRLRRGFDQAGLLAERLSRLLGKPISERNLCRIRATASQTGLSESKRRENVRGAFKVRRSAEVTGKRVLLVDDVMTTGATASECARTLLSAGAKEVSVLVGARAQPGSAGAI
ncbi:MAG: hypothetical protein AMS15_01450 [Planctomycetes bacterium DG_23]|nr:MAG: hypothetical protein AMS15_01450 [Planctomycetes bacterium DG_23]